MGVSSPPADPVADTASGPARPLEVFRDPLKVFLALALAFGVPLALTVPRFGGTDEPAHFFRAYQISTGRLLPEPVGDDGFSGACLPRSLIAEQKRDSAAYYAHLSTHVLGEPAGPPVEIAPDALEACPTDPSRGVVTFSTFGSPVPYVPQATAIFLARQLDSSAGAMLLAARFALLASYCTLVAVAIARAPRSKWALCGTALLPIALFLSSGTVSHDALTTGITLLVVSSALRALSPPAGVTTRALVVEAVALSALLAMGKPTYIVVAGLYLLPLLDRELRADRWPLALAPAAGALVTVVWNAAVDDLWKTDAGYFGVAVDDVAQRHELLHRPWDFGFDLVRSVYHQLWHWLHTLVSVGGSVTAGPALLAVIGLAVYVAVLFQRDRTDDDAAGLQRKQRALVGLVFVSGLVLVAAANYVFWTEPGASVVTGIRPRYFVPLFPLLAIALGPSRFRWERSRTAVLPVAVLLVPTLATFATILSFRMH